MFQKLKVTDTCNLSQVSPFFNQQLIRVLPVFWSSFDPLTLSRALMQRSRATPPPGTIPSSTAALVAHRASLTRSFFSLTSTSLDPPIYWCKQIKHLVLKYGTFTMLTNHQHANANLLCDLSLHCCKKTIITLAFLFSAVKR